MQLHTSQTTPQQTQKANVAGGDRLDEQDVRGMGAIKRPLCNQMGLLDSPCGPSASLLGRSIPLMGRLFGQSLIVLLSVAIPYFQLHRSTGVSRVKSLARPNLFLLRDLHRKIVMYYLLGSLIQLQKEYFVNSFRDNAGV